MSHGRCLLYAWPCGGRGLGWNALSVFYVTKNIDVVNICDIALVNECFIS